MASCTNCGNEVPEGAVYCPKCGAAVTRPAEPVVSAATASRLTLATWGERFVAWIIDAVIVGAIALIVNGLVGLAGLVTSISLVQGWPTWLPFFNVGLNEIFLFFYWMFMEGSSGRSFGKMIMRLKVMRLDGSNPTMAQAAVSSVGKAFILWLDVLLGWALFWKKRQRIFNYLSATLVVRAR